MLADRITDWVINHPRKIILLCIAMVMVAGIGAVNTKVTIDYRVYFSGENKQLKQLEYIEAIFEEGTNVYFLVQPKNGDAFSRDTIAAVSELTEKAKLIPKSMEHRVTSLSTFSFSYSPAPDELVFEPLVPNGVHEDPSVLSDDDLKFIRKEALANKVFVRSLVDEAGTMLGVNVPLALKNNKGHIPEITTYAEKLRDEMKAKYPDIEFGLTGMVMMDKTMSDLIDYDLATIVPLSVLMIFLFLALLLRNPRGMAITMAVIGLSVTFAMGLLGWTGTPISPPTAISPTIILTLAVADCVHILTNYYHQIRLGDDKHTALRTAMRLNLLPVALTSVTTALGFLTLNFSESPPFAHLGNTVAAGVMMAFVLSILFLPAVLVITKPGAGRKTTAAENTMSALSEFVIRFRIPLLISTSCIAIGSAFLVPQNDLNERWLDYFKEGVEFRDVSNTIGENMSGTHRIEWVMRSEGEFGIHDPQYLQFVDDFRNWCKSEKHTRYCGSYVETIKLVHRLVNDDDPAYETIPDEKGTAQQLFLSYLSGVDTGNRVDVGESVTRFLLVAHGLTSNEVLQLEKNGSDWLRANAPEHMHEIGAGVDIIFGQIAWDNIRAMLKGTGLALLLISLLLVFALRSVKIGIISILPNLMPGVLGFGAWALIDGQVGLSLSIVVCMTLGIVVDDTIHFLSKYLHARRDKGLDAEESVRYVFNTVGTALLTTSVVLTAGFIIMVLSPLVPNADLGILASIMIMFALFADFFFLPPLLITISKWLERKNAKTAKPNS